jgi:nucleoside 2-deoxyribosyltransferase
MESLKLYIASSFQNKFLCEILKMFLTKNLTTQFLFTFIVVSDWHSISGCAESNKDRSETDLRQVELADVVVAVYPYGKEGTLCELSYAYGLGKYCIYIRDDIFEDDDPLIVGDFSLHKLEENKKGVIVRDMFEVLSNLIDIGGRIC